MTKTKEARSDERMEPKQDKQNRGEQRSYALQPRRGYELHRPESPFALMRRFNDEMDRMIQNFGFGRGFSETTFGGEMGQGGPAMWSPQVEVFERGGELVVRADLPGMTKDDVEVNIAENALVIRGQRRSEREEEEEGYYRTERSYGSFYRTIPLPDGAEAENADATFRNGVLEITMPAPERTERRRLDIHEAEEERPRTKATAGGQK